MSLTLSWTRFSPNNFGQSQNLNLQEIDGGDTKQKSTGSKQNVEEEGEEEYYENDSFIIDDDGANDRDGDLTGSSARSDL